MDEILADQTRFNKFMEEIDENLKTAGFTIPQRPLQAVAQFARKNEIKISGSSDLARRILNWYDQRYGERLKVDLGSGEVVLIIRGDPYKIYIPWLVGSFHLICDKTCRNYPEPIINVLSLIDGLTTSNAQTLHEMHIESILGFFVFASQTLSSFRGINNLRYKAEAEADLRVAVANILFQGSPQYGQSKWASLQFTEKIMKAYIFDRCKKEPPYTHILSDLKTMLDKTTLPIIPSYLLENIQCKPDVRYNSSLVNLEDCINAHHSSLRVLNILLGVGYFPLGSSNTWA